MDAVKFIEEKNRMCQSYFDSPNKCQDCPAYAQCEDITDTSIVAVVEKWSRKHPINTRQSRLLDMFPNVKIGQDGIVDLFPCAIDSTWKCKDHGFLSVSDDCAKCRKLFWTESLPDNAQ